MHVADSGYSIMQDVRDFILHLLSDEKAQQWLYVAVRALPCFIAAPTATR